MFKKRVKRQLKRIPISYLILALLFNILPFARPVALGDDTKKRLDKVDFRGGEENGPDRVTLLETPAEALEARLAVLQSARETIDITYYKIISGSSTDAVLGELLLAADRGVQVRVLVDGRSGDRAVRRRLRLLSSHPNISYRRYNPIHLLRPWEWQAALHDKFIIVDNTWLLLGGRNLGDRYYGPQGYDRSITNDRDVLVWRAGDPDGLEASVLPQATAYMEELWNCKHTASTRQKPMGNDERQKLLDALESFRADNPRFFTQTLADYRDRCLPTGRVTLIRNPIHTGKKEPELAYQMGRIGIQAQSLLVSESGREYVPGQETPAVPVKLAKRALMAFVSVFSRLFQFLI